jgi:O-antigen/teichoic acid export membrane protein
VTTVRHHLATSSAWAIAGFASLSLGSLAVNAILTRALTPEAVGIYFLAVSLVSFAAAIGRVGLNQAVVRLLTYEESAGGPVAAASVWRTTRRLGTTTAITSGLVLAFVVLPVLASSAFDSPRLGHLGPLLGLWCVIEALRLIAAEALRGFGNVGAATMLGDAGRQILFLLAVTSALLVTGVLSLVVVVASATTAGGVVLAVALVRLRLRTAGIRVGETMPATEILQLAAPMMVTAVSLLAVSQGDVWLAATFLNDHDVGVYAATSRLVLLVVFPLHICNVVLTPVVARLHSRGKRTELERVLRLGATAAAVPTLVIVAVLLAGGDFVLDLVYGDVYRQGAAVLAVLACGQLVNALVGACGQALLMTGHQRLMMTVTAASGVLFVGGGALATWWLGSLGLAAASAITTAGRNLVLWRLARSRLGVRTEATFSRAFLTGPTGR